MKPFQAAKTKQSIISAGTRPIFNLNNLAKKMVKISLVSVLAFCHCMAIAKPHFNNNSTFDSTSTIPILNWSRQVGGTNYPFTGAQGKGISADNSGNIYVTGYTNVGISGQIQNGSADYFISKYDSGGNLKWSRQVGAAGGYTYGYGVSADNSGNIYVTGQTNVGLSGQKQNGYQNYFIAKYDLNSNLIWTRQVGPSGGGGSTLGYGTSADESGNIYVTGSTSGGLSGQIQNGYQDYFIAKYDVNGNLKWSRQVGSSGRNTIGYGITADESGNIYVTGSTNAGISGQKQNGLYDYFIAKYDLNGNLQWSRQVGSSGGSTYGYGISADESGNIYVTGSTNAGISGQKQNGLYDYFIAKYDLNGNLQWSRQVGTSRGSAYGKGVSTDNFGNIYVTGNTNIGLSGQKQNGSQDYFIAKYDSNGNLQYGRQVGSRGGGVSETRGNGISADNLGNIYVTGYTTVGISGQKQNGYYDYFIARFIDDGAWNKQAGNSGGVTYGSGISTDTFGNIYITGQTSVGLFGQTQTGNYDYFITKYTPDGYLQWTKQVGNYGGWTREAAINVNNSGNIYVTGATTIGISGQKKQGILDYYITKYTPEGVLQWTKQVGNSASGLTYGNGVSTDGAENAYITGATSRGLSGQQQNGKNDYFIAKYDLNGNFQWSRQVGVGGGYTYGKAISTDKAGNSYITGYTNVGLSGQIQTGIYDYFIAKYDVNGNLQWSRQVGTTGGNTQGYGISADESGNIYVTGSTNAGISGQKQNGLWDYFIAKYDAAGTLVYTFQVGAVNGVTWGKGVSIDNLGNVYIAGTTTTGIYGQIQNGKYDYFIAEYNASGTLLDTVQVGAAGGNTYGFGISADNFGYIYVTGNTDVGISGQTQTGLEDYFIARYIN